MNPQKKQSSFYREEQFKYKPYNRQDSMTPVTPVFTPQSGNRNFRRQPTKDNFSDESGSEEMYVGYKKYPTSGSRVKELDQSYISENSEGESKESSEDWSADKDDLKQTKLKMMRQDSDRFIYLEDEESRSATPIHFLATSPGKTSEVINKKDKIHEIRQELLENYEVVKPHNAVICFLHMFFKIVAVFW